MNKWFSPSFWLRCGASAFILAAVAAPGQLPKVQYYPGNFELHISFACDCAGLCGTNLNTTNSPVGAFLAANGVVNVSGSSALAAADANGINGSTIQYVPKHYELFDTISSFNFEGWTKTPVVSSSTVLFTSGQGSVNFSPPASFSTPIYPYPIIAFDYTEGILNPLLPGTTPPNVAGGAGNGVDKPLPIANKNQPYPWDVNATLTLQNGQTYAMEQQLAVGPDPLLWGLPVPGSTTKLAAPVYYSEASSVLSISLYCVQNGVPVLFGVSYPTVTATLLPVNIPPPLNDVTADITGAAATETMTGNLFQNWTWPLTPDDLVDLSGSGKIPGAAGSVQASLGSGSPQWAGYVAGPNNIDHLQVLVRGSRAYQVVLSYYLKNNNGVFVPMPPLTNIMMSAVQPCQTMEIAFYTTNECSATPGPNSPCLTEIIGQFDMLGNPNDPPGVNIYAYGGPGGSVPGGSFNTGFNDNLTGAALAGLPGTPVNFVIPDVVASDAFFSLVGDIPYSMYATMALGKAQAYEYFSSPMLYPVEAKCGQTNNLTNIFVMCPSDPGIVQGTVSLNGPISPGYYGGAAALSFLQFATYLPNGLPVDSGNSDPTLFNVCYIEADGGASANPPFNIGGGLARTEFDDPATPGFASPNSYTGKYSLALAGLQSQPSTWSANDLHLVFGSPVNLIYDVIETNLAFTNVITCGANIENNIDLCFGLQTVQVTNAYLLSNPYSSVSIQVSGSGPGYIVPKFTVTSFSGSPNNAYFQLFLPAGTYTVVPTAEVTLAAPYNGTEFITLPATNYVVGCSNVVTNCFPTITCPTNKTVPCGTYYWPECIGCLVPASATNWSFSGTVGRLPNGNLTPGNNGVFYGTTAAGGSNGFGTVFSFNTNSGTLSVLHGFSGSNGDGSSPATGLLKGTDGTLYGTTSAGGAHGLGTVFKISTDGRNYAVLHSFAGAPGDAQGPTNLLAQGSDGMLYGTTSTGGSNGFGAVFKLATTGSAYAILHSFSGASGDAQNPSGGVVEGTDGGLYGATAAGGANGQGTLFKLNLDGSVYAILHSFTGTNGDGSDPSGSLVQGAGGALFGTTTSGGANGSGMVFQLSPDGSGYAVSFSFTGTNGGGNPACGLLAGSDGGLYGVTTTGGSGSLGTVFRLNQDGSGFMVLGNFGGSGGGQNPNGGLIQTLDGTLLGTTAQGGLFNQGLIYFINPLPGWSFDPPIVVAQCCTNIKITVQSTVTTGTCPQVITRTWRISDCDGTNHFCSQTVTVEHTNAPVMNCPHDLVVNSCTNVAVAYAPTATDGCTGGKVIVVCNPPSGSHFAPNTTTTVTCTATNACGYTSSCSFTVTVQCGTTNCCADCTMPYPLSYTLNIVTGDNYLADNLCQGTNNTLAQVLGTNWTTEVQVFTYSTANQGFSQGDTFFTAADTGTVGGWYDSNFNPSTTTLTPGEGFLLYNPGGATNVVIHGCEPTCAPPCSPVSGHSLVGKLGLGVAGWSNLFSCPPQCGTEVGIFNSQTQTFTTNTFVNSMWTPAAPLLGAGQSAFVSVQPNTNCPGGPLIPRSTGSVKPLDSAAVPIRLSAALVIVPAPPGARAFQLTLTGLASGSYIIERTTDLIHWSQVTNLVSSGGTAQYLDTNEVATANRFYRFHQVPGTAEQ